MSLKKYLFLVSLLSLISCTGTKINTSVTPTVEERIPIKEATSTSVSNLAMEIPTHTPENRNTIIIPTMEETREIHLEDLLSGKIYLLTNMEIQSLDILSGKFYKVFSFENDDQINEMTMDDQETFYFISYYDNANPQTDIKRYKIKDTKSERLTYDGTYKTNLAVSSNGTKIAYISDFETLILMKQIQDQFIKSIVDSTENLFNGISFSPNGDKLAYIKCDETQMNFQRTKGQLHLYDIPNHQEEEFSLGGLSCFQGSITWFDENSLFIWELTGSHKKLIHVDLESLEKTTISQDYELTGVVKLAPSKDQILFDGVRNGEYELNLFDLKSENLTTIYKEKYDDIKVNNIYSAWSQDGKYIGFWLTQFILHDVTSGELITLDDVRMGGLNEFWWKN